MCGRRDLPGERGSPSALPMAAMDATRTSSARPVSQPTERVAAEGRAPFVSAVRQLSLADYVERSRTSKGLAYLPVYTDRRVVYRVYGYMKSPLCLFNWSTASLRSEASCFWPTRWK